MLYLYGFEEIGVVVSEVFFVDPEPAVEGQEGPEAGVRVEVRQLDRQPLKASIYSATPMGVDTPLLRFDLLESFPEGLGTLDRVHWHPTFEGWDPSWRAFDEELSADPLSWLRTNLADLDRLLGTSGHPDAPALAQRTDEIVDTVGRLWDEVRAGAFNPPEEGWTSEPAFRRGWL
jgi:hypothetical protein